mmetsp:Transcript_109240/g.339191  ORF Transcript_109240/g.339191 Transcript_109240/m.339191 type:complete len:215 (-) Transcript_109240:943-1587(-)
MAPKPWQRRRAVDRPRPPGVPPAVGPPGRAPLLPRLGAMEDEVEAVDDAPAPAVVVDAPAEEKPVPVEAEKPAEAPEAPAEPAPAKKRRSRWGQEPELPPVMPDALALAPMPGMPGMPGMPAGGGPSSCTAPSRAWPGAHPCDASCCTLCCCGTAVATGPCDSAPTCAPIDSFMRSWQDPTAICSAMPVPGKAITGGGGTYEGQPWMTATGGGT